MSRLQGYYRPYDSGDEESDMSSDEDVSDDEQLARGYDPRISRQEDPRYAILRAAGPTFSTSAQQEKYMEQMGGAPFDVTTNITSLKDHVYLDPPKTTKTSLISIKSINRDKNVFPTPYRFQLKLPRTYKNVTKFQMVQMSYPNSNSQNISQANLITSTIVRDLVLKGVPSSCISDCIGVITCGTSFNTFGLIEQGRVNSDGAPLLLTIPVADGTYTDAQLAREVTFKANSTPPFNLISYDAFRDTFMYTRDVLVLFNEPGEGFYSNATNKRYGHHTKEDIMNTYYTQQYIDSLPEITEKIAFNAYYFPILKEVIATKMGKPFILLGDTGVIYEQLEERVMGIFEGLDSDFYYTICLLNRGSLDSYRRHHTFEFRNVNKYNIIHNATDQKNNIIHDSLHPSLNRDIANKYNMVLNQHIRLADLNVHSFKTLKSELCSYSAIFKHLETNLSTVLGNYYFVTGFKYTGGSDYITAESTFHTDDLESDVQFTTMFNYTSSIGGIYGNVEGSVMSFSTFTDYHSTLSSYYQIMQSTSQSISSIHGRVNQDHHLYVSTKYSGILPSNMIEARTYNQNQGLPVSFVTGDPVYIPGQSVPNIIQYNAGQSSNILEYNTSTCNYICCSTITNIVKSWYSCLPTNFVTKTMQYRLGLVQILPNSFNLISTVVELTSTGNLNIFMQINDEQGFNNMDITMPENYNITNETTGQVKLVAAKILMGQAGDSGISQTVIQNPSLFENTLGKLDRLDFKLYYDDQAITPAWLYAPYQFDFSEWNATFQVDEEVGFANRATGWGSKPSIPVPENANDTPYIFFSHKDNPNNS